jgi:hypothetical protein
MLLHFLENKGQYKLYYDVLKSNVAQRTDIANYLDRCPTYPKIQSINTSLLLNLFGRPHVPHKDDPQISPYRLTQLLRNLCLYVRFVFL